MSTNNSETQRAEVERGLNALRLTLAAEGRAVGFIHRAGGEIELTVFDKQPGGTLYIGPVLGTNHEHE